VTSREGYAEDGSLDAAAVARALARGRTPSLARSAFFVCRT
jgi:hypothetical protein